jgi:hypothetical protein
VAQFKFRRVSDDVLEVTAYGVKYVMRVDRNQFSLEVLRGRKRLEQGTFRQPEHGADYELADSRGHLLRIKTRREGEKMISEITRNDETQQFESGAAEHGVRLVAALRAGRGSATPYIRRFLTALRKNATFRQEVMEKSQLEAYVAEDVIAVACAAICTLAAIQPEFMPACLVCLLNAEGGIRVPPVGGFD